jgi:hypothetical protein
MKKLLILTIALFASSALALPTINQVVVSGYLGNSSGPLTTGNYPGSITLNAGGTPLACTNAANIDVTDGYFTQTVSCTAATLNAGTGGITADVSVTISGSPVTFTVNAYPVPTALVASIANSVSAGVITNAMVSGSAAITVDKLGQSSANTGDVLTWNGTAWVPSNSPTYGGAVTMSTGATITTGGLTVSAGGASLTGNSLVTGTLGVTDTLNATKATGTGLAVVADATVGGNLGVTGTTTSGGALAVTTGGLTVSAGGASITGTSTITGTLGVTDALSLTKASGTGLAVTADATVGGTLGVTGNVTTGNTLTVGTSAATIRSASAQGLTVTAQGAATTTIGTSAQATTLAGNTTVNGTLTVGSLGTALTGMGKCTFTSAITNAWANYTCTGIPATVPTSAFVHCSPNADSSAAVAVQARVTGTLNQIRLRATAAATSVAWTCFYAY